MKTKLLFLAFFIAIFAMRAQHADNWELQNLGLSAYPRAADAISIVDENTVWVSIVDGTTGSGGPNTTEFYRTTDGGATWNGQAVVDDSNSGIANICAVNANVAWASIYDAADGATQGVFKTTDGGANWVKQSTAVYGDGASFINIVHFFNENDGVCQGDPVDGYFEVYTTSDGGAQWTRVPQANIPDPIADEYGTVGYFTTYEDVIWFTTTKGRIFKSTDKGLTWVVYATDQTTQIHLAFSDENNGYMANAGVFWTTNNGGESWNIAFPENVYTSDLCAIPNSTVLFSSGGSTNDGNGSSFSTDSGVSFTGICDGEAQHYNIEFLNGSTGWSSAWNVEGEAGTGGIVKYIGPEVVSTLDFDSKGFVAFPNPVEEIFHMTANEAISHVSVVNMIGQEVYSSVPSTLSHTIDMSSFERGTYLVNVTIDGAQGTIKVIK